METQTVNLTEILVATLPATKEDLVQALLAHGVRPGTIAELVRLARQGGQVIVRQDGVYHTDATADRVTLLVDEHRKIKTLATQAATAAGMYPTPGRLQAAQVYAGELAQIDRSYRLTRKEQSLERKLARDQEELAAVRAEQMEWNLLDCRSQ
jgi:acetolactate synthase regulatory subunit